LIAATWILFVLGILGATDIALFHTLSHGIRKHPDCRTELLVHSLRGPTYAALFLLVPNVAMHGHWYWAMCAILVFDLGLSVWDFLIERRSRARLGGLPSGEYLLHVLLGILYGAFAAMLLSTSTEWPTKATALVWVPVQVPAFLRYLLAVFAVGVFVSGALDALAWWRLGKRNTILDAPSP
jgi:hypothetical protein